MIKATGFAMQAAPIDKNDRPSLRTALLAVAASILLVACGGGAQTTSLPAPNGTGNTNDNLGRFGNQLSQYLYAIVQFQTFNTEDKPFPFGKWPESENPD